MFMFNIKMIMQWIKKNLERFVKYKILKFNIEFRGYLFIYHAPNTKLNFKETDCQILNS